jgi:hypothetical protein
MWSHILSRTSWRYSDNLAAKEESRKRINAYAATKVIVKNGAYIKHPELREVTPELFASNGVHLTFLGNSTFIKQLVSALQAFIWDGVKCFQ